MIPRRRKAETGRPRGTCLRILTRLLLAASFLLLLLPGRAEASEYVFRAEDGGGIGAGWSLFLDALPEDAGELSETDLSDPGAAAETVRSALSPEKLTGKLKEAARRAAESVLPAAAPLVGLVLLCAAVRFALPPDSAVREGMERILRLAASVTVFRLSAEALGLADRAVSAVCRLAELLVPVAEGICLFGGGVTEARVTRVGLMLAATAAEEAAGRILIPLSGVVLGLCAVSGGKGMAARTAGALRRLLLRIWQAVALGMSFLLGAQSVLARAADTAGVRWTRFALSSFVPVAGSALSDAWTSIAAGLRALRGAAGIGGILAMTAAAAPAVIPLLLWQAVFALTKAAAEALDLRELSPVLEEAGGIVGLLAAFCLYALAMFTVELALFAGIRTG